MFSGGEGIENDWDYIYKPLRLAMKKRSGGTEKRPSLFSRKERVDALAQAGEREKAYDNLFRWPKLSFR